MRPLARLERRLEALRALDEADVATELDRILHDGYAHVLQLEAERSRVTRRVQELAARADEVAAAQELRRLARVREQLDRDVEALRALLGGAGRIQP
ncbi:MAG TPA: hypothetical protein VNB64_02440 [Solirubrobacteraceae bacterium]|nr:hypothetical protein [Solirubrobacteraceae bacterium]